MTHADDALESPARGPGHVVPLRLLLGVLAALLALTVVTVAVAYVDLGPLNLIVALSIAMIKASLVLLVFMHLLWDRPFHAVVLLTSLALVVLFLIFTLIDAHHYHPEVIPGYAPEMRQ